MSRRRAFIILGAATCFLIALVVAFTITPFGFRTETAASIDLTGMQFAELSEHFTLRAQKDGAAAAFAELGSAALPTNTDLHLLGHVIGDELYRQQGVAGIALCTDDFRNACSHSIVIGTLLEHGEGAIPLIRDACARAPGGSGAYTMCFHGLGHGVLAYHSYDLEETISFCGRLGTDAYGNREYHECVGGAIMEIIGGGGHDRQVWEAQRALYFASDDPLALCAYPFMTPEIAPMCYTYLTPYLFEAAGGDLGSPSEADYEAAFAYCDALPSAERDNRAACFGGLGKEFVVLVQGRDIRALESLATAQLKTVHRWCALAPAPEGVRACVDSALSSLFWGGENDPQLAIRFCNAAADAELQATCYDALYREADAYVRDADRRAGICAASDSLYQERCRTLLVPEVS